MYIILGLLFAHQEISLLQYHMMIKVLNYTVLLLIPLEENSTKLTSCLKKYISKLRSSLIWNQEG